MAVNARRQEAEDNKQTPREVKALKGRNVGRKEWWGGRIRRFKGLGYKNSRFHQRNQNTELSMLKWKESSGGRRGRRVEKQAGLFSFRMPSPCGRLNFP